MSFLCYVRKLVQQEISCLIYKLYFADWLKVNAGTKGVYRVLYSSDMLEKLKPCVKQHLLPPVDRLGIISDLFAQVNVHSSTCK